MIATGLALVAGDAAWKAYIPAADMHYSQLVLVIRDLPSAAGFALIIGAAAARPTGRLLGNRVLASMGTISYGFYLWHVPVLVFLRGHGLLPLHPVYGTFVALVPALAVSALSWVVLERPIIDWAARRNERARAERRDRFARSRRSGGGGVDRRAGGREVSTVRA
jgi:peptidoglycan/LPS O-acetylase OafA/YrhL